MRTAIIPLPVSVLVFTSLCNGFLSNFGRPESIQGYQHQHNAENAFGVVDLPLGTDQDGFSQNVWSHGSIDPQMYTQYTQPSPYDSNSQFAQQEDYSHLVQGYQQQSNTGYGLSHTTGHENPADRHGPVEHFHSYDYHVAPEVHGSQTSASHAVSYQSQPYMDFADYSNAGLGDEYRHHHDTAGRWTASSGEETHSSALDVTAGPASRTRTGGGDVFMQPVGGSASERALTPKEQESLIVKEIIEEEIQKRNLHSNMHPQRVAEQVCEMKITHPGRERAIGFAFSNIVDGWRNGGDYMYDYQGWTVTYRNRVNCLRHAFKQRMSPLPHEMMQFLLDNFRDLPTNFHGTLADPGEEQNQLQSAVQVWNHFWEARLDGVIRSDAEVTPLIVAQRSKGFKTGDFTIAQTISLIKKYLRTFLRFKHTDIEELETLTKRQATH